MTLGAWRRVPLGDETLGYEEFRRGAAIPGTRSAVLFGGSRLFVFDLERAERLAVIDEWPHDECHLDVQEDGTISAQYQTDFRVWQPEPDSSVA